MAQPQISGVAGTARSVVLELKKNDEGLKKADGESGWQEKQGRHASPRMGLPSPTSGKNEH